VLTLWGWTPSLRTIVGGRVLPCGCLLGEYETWGAEVVTILDAHDPRCTNQLHRSDAVLERYPVRTLSQAFDQGPDLEPLSR
jgi:hypothetical protein